MYKPNKVNQTKLKINTSYEGETIETKVKRITVNNEPIKDSAPIIFTERKQGVEPAYNIRTDKWDLALDAMSVVTQVELDKRLKRHAPTPEKTTEQKVESITPQPTTVNNETKS